MFMFWYCLVFFLRALRALLMLVLLVLLVVAVLGAACQEAGGQGLPVGAMGSSLVEFVGEHVRVLRNSLPPTEF